MITTLKRTLRSLRRSPVFLVTATASLAIGLGLSTATFTMVDTIRHPKLPYADADRLYFMRLRWGNQRNPPPVGEQMRALATIPAIERVALSVTEYKNVEVNGAAAGRGMVYVTPRFFDLVGIRTRLGRLPNAEEARTQTAVVVTQPFWHQYFADRATLDGAFLGFGDRTYAVVGVLVRGAERSFRGDVWIPFASEGAFENVRSNSILVKLRSGVDPGAVERQLAPLAAGFTAQYVSPSAPPYVIQLRSIVPKPDQLSDFDILLLCIAIGVLAIAATNVAALTLARGLMRRRDFALRIALGASRWAIARDVLAEVTVVAVLGAAGGVLAAMALLGVLTHIVPEEMTWTWFVVPELSARQFAFVAFALVAAIAMAGALPAWRASRVDPSDPLKDAAGSTTGRSRSEFRVLVIGELAISMVLLMLASLLTLSTRNFANFEFGYEAHRILAARIEFWRMKDTLSAAERTRLRVSTLERVRSTPGVALAATSTGVPTDGKEVISDARARGEPPLELWNYLDVDPAFFATLGIPIVAGRDFFDGDRLHGGAVILSQRAEKKLFPRGDAIGRMVKLGGERSARPWLPVVGIVRDIEEQYTRRPDGEQEPAIYASTPNFSTLSWRIVFRPAGTDPQLAVAVQRTLRDILPPLASSRVGPYLDYFDYSLRMHQFFARLFGFVGTAAMLLGAAGLFSVLSYAVGQRMREFAVRSALGAAPRDLLRIVLKSGLEMALGGTAIGALLSFWASAAVSSFLFGVKNTDPVSLVVAEGTLLAVTMLASLVPALRAMRADPVEVLRAT